MFDAEPGIKERSINRNKYTSMIKESSKTAQRDLQYLVKKGIIVPLPERGRSTRYTLKLQEFTQAVTRVELVEITDRLLVQQIAKNHLIVHRRDQLANIENIHIKFSIDAEIGSFYFRYHQPQVEFMLLGRVIIMVEMVKNLMH